jgi:hypothetical protein
MNEDDGSALADIMDVGADAAGLDGSGDFRMRFTHDLISAARRKATSPRHGLAQG